ncbi:hypothetical protein UM89_18395 [Bacillus subtilis]|nr:hypothetical protein UM89_18395 [Bacillus subtilis]
MKRLYWALLLAVLIIAGRPDIVQATGDTEQTEDPAQTAEQLAERTAPRLKQTRSANFGMTL